MVAINRKLFFLYKSIAVLGIISALVFGYIYFEPVLTEREIVITIINYEKFPKEPGKYYIFTKTELFENTNYRYHNKTNADQLIGRLIKGQTYKVKVVGFYFPSIHKFRNIIDIVDYNIKSKPRT